MTAQWLLRLAEVSQLADRHPKIHKAIHVLQNARKDLQAAAHDYNGHRPATIPEKPSETVMAFDDYTSLLRRRL